MAKRRLRHLRSAVAPAAGAARADGTLSGAAGSESPALRVRPLATSFGAELSGLQLSGIVFLPFVPLTPRPDGSKRYKKEQKDFWVRGDPLHLSLPP